MLTLLQALRSLAVYQVISPIAVCFLVVTKLLVLDRLIEFSKLKAIGSLTRWALLGRVLVAVVVIGSTAGLVSNIVSSVLVIQAAGKNDELAAGASSGINTREWRNATYEQSKSLTSQAARAASVYIAFECFVLILIVVAFCFAGVACVRRVRAALSGSRVSQSVSMTVRANRRASALLTADVVDPAVAVQGRKLQRQILVTCSVVFVSFLIRAMYAAMFVFASVAQNYDAKCDSFGEGAKSKCRVCNNAFANMLVWLLHTPQFYFALAFISYPLALLIALWGMTSGQMLSVMRARAALIAVGNNGH
jgi:hypothetical protein